MNTTQLHWRKAAVGMYLAEANGYAAMVFKDGTRWVAKVTDNDPAYLGSFVAAKHTAECLMGAR